MSPLDNVVFVWCWRAEACTYSPQEAIASPLPLLSSDLLVEFLRSLLRCRSVVPRNSTNISHGTRPGCIHFFRCLLKVAMLRRTDHVRKCWLAQRMVAQDRTRLCACFCLLRICGPDFLRSDFVRPYCGRAGRHGMLCDLILAEVYRNLISTL